jgi:hypothetical protein
MPWGTTNLTAHYDWLGEFSTNITIQPTGPNRIQFSFEHATLVLTNLPSDISISETNGRDFSATNGWVYETLGPHSFTLRGDCGAQTKTLTIADGTNYLFTSLTNCGWRSANGIEMVLVKGLPDAAQKGYVGKLEVTQEQYQKIMNANPSEPQQPDFPVNNITAEDALKFCKALTELDSVRPGFPRGFKYALPTEVQWQYFAAGTSTEGAVLGSGGKGVMQKAGTSPARANPYGLQDVLGNVWEICVSGTKTMVLGGCYNYSRAVLQNMVKNNKQPQADFGGPLPQVGFRLVLVPDKLQLSQAPSSNGQ